MPIEKEITIKKYKCVFCDYEATSEMNCAQHETTCINNPNFQKDYKEYCAKAQNIIDNSKSVFNYLEDMKKLLKNYGIIFDVNLVNMKINEKIYISHNAPKGVKQYSSHNSAEDSRKYAPGYTGTIVGQVKYEDDILIDKFSNRDKCFSRYCNIHGIPGLDIIHTGSGGSRTNGYEYSVNIYIEDFPKMYEDYLTHVNGQKRYINDGLQNVIDSQNDVINTLFQDYKKYDHLYDNISEIQYIIEDCRSRLYELKKIYTPLLKSKFVSEHTFELPVIEHSIFDDQIISKLGDISTFINIFGDKDNNIKDSIVIESKKIKNLYEKVNDIKLRIDTLIKEHPELYI